MLSACTGIGRSVLGPGQAVIAGGWSAEFRDVQRTLPRATLLTILIVTLIYTGVALAVVGTGSYGSPALDRISLGIIIDHRSGPSAGDAVADAAVVVCLGTTSAFVASVSPLGYALARDGWAPRVLSRRNRRDTPAAAIRTVAAIGAAGLAGALAFCWGTSDIAFIPSVLVLATYLLAAAAARLLTGRQRATAIVASRCCW